MTVLSRFGRISECDGQIDRQTDERTELLHVSQKN